MTHYNIHHNTLTRVFLDSHYLPTCIEANSSENWALCHNLDGQGQPMYDDEGDAVYIMMYGDVLFIT